MAHFNGMNFTLRTIFKAVWFRGWADQKGLAYVDDSTPEEIAALKGTPTVPGKNSPYKSRSISENLDLFERMRKGEFKDG